MAAAAVLGGARSHAAIAEFAREVPKQLLARVGGWLACQQDAPGAVAVDGKTLRGAVDADGRQVHLLAALAHGSGVVLAQRRVDAKSNEITGFRPLLEGVDLQGRVVTADALHTQTEHARYLVGDRQADYLFCVKGNQPTLEAARAGPARLGVLARGQWEIENRAHWVRDVGFDEDRSQVRTGHGPQVMATLRNLAISLLRLGGYDNIARGVRWTGRDRTGTRAFALLGI